MALGQDFEDLTPISPRPRAEDGKSSLPKVFAHVYHKLSSIPRRVLRRRPAISDLRSLFFNPLEKEAVEVSNSKKAGRQHAAVKVSHSLEPEIEESPAVGTGTSPYPRRHVYTTTPGTLERRTALVPPIPNTRRPGSQRAMIVPASHPHPLRSHDPWPAHPRSRTSRPRRRGQVFSQAERNRMRKLLPAIEEGLDEADEVRGLAIANNIGSVPSIVVCDYDSVIAGFPGFARNGTVR